MKRVIFASDDLPAHWEDHTRFAEWKRLLTGCYHQLDVRRAGEGRFSMRFEFSQFGPVGVGQFAGSPVQIAKQLRGEDAADAVVIIEIDRGPAPLLLSHDCSEAASSQAAAAYRDGEQACCENDRKIHTNWTGLVVERRLLLDAVADAEIFLVRPLDPDVPAVRHLKRYLDILGGPDGVARDISMHIHIGATLFDLIELALVTGRDPATVVRSGGVRASQLQKVVTLIEAGFADRAFSAHVVAAKLCLSARYIQDLLQDTGASFTERVMELRLQKARAMLTGDRHAALKVSDVALSCGFNEVSYFHRCFRRRFGASPALFREGVGTTA
jgi:AraC-like DNA-binding protein